MEVLVLHFNTFLNVVFSSTLCSANTFATFYFWACGRHLIAFLSFDRFWSGIQVYSGDRYHGITINTPPLRSRSGQNSKCFRVPFICSVRFSNVRVPFMFFHRFWSSEVPCFGPFLERFRPENGQKGPIFFAARFARQFSNFLGCSLFVLWDSQIVLGCLLVRGAY